MSTSAQNNLEGQRALVTGATSDIGRAVALQLARDGAEVVVHRRNEAHGATTVREIEATDGTASFVAADLADATDVKWLAGEVGDVDILVNNAGIALYGPPAEFDPAEQHGRREVGLVVGAAYGATKASLEAEVIAFLVSSRASYITGATIAADGGRRAI